MDEVVVLYTVWPDAETAAAAAEAAVQARLAGCVNVLGAVRSIYRWAGALEQSDEVAALFKTRADKAEALRALIVARHPYALPAILALPVAAQASHRPYLDWIATETDGG